MVHDKSNYAPNPKLQTMNHPNLRYWFMFCFTSAVGLCLSEVDGVDYRKNFSNPAPLPFFIAGLGV